jgi:hypothetical protein
MHDPAALAPLLMHDAMALAPVDDSPSGANPRAAGPSPRGWDTVTRGHIVTKLPVSQPARVALPEMAALPARQL